MREKLNKNYIADSDNEVDSYPSKYDKSLFYKRFKSHFDRLLNQDKNSTDFQELEKVYVEQKAIQNQLGAFIGSNIDNCQFIIGPTGIGKSTNLRKFFDFKTQTPSIRHKNLIIPILCNELHIEGNGSSLRVQLANIIETACMLLERDFKEKIMYSDEEFYDFILANKADVLTRVRSKPNLSIEENLLLVHTT
ncbi:MAG: hypothetical protein KIT26_08410 [Nitrosomonas sp.]|nr:hypothetical protein [Nitrosomonas sp.]